MLYQRKVESFTKEQLNDLRENLNSHNSEIRLKPSKTFTTVDNRYQRKHQNHWNSKDRIDTFCNIRHERLYVK